MIENPLRQERVQKDIERFIEKVLAETGTGTIEITIAFNIRDRRCASYRLGVAASRKLLTGGAESA